MQQISKEARLDAEELFESLRSVYERKTELEMKLSHFDPTMTHRELRALRREYCKIVEAYEALESEYVITWVR